MPKLLIFGVTPAQGGIETFVLNVCKVMQGLADIYLYNFSNDSLAYNDIFTKEYDVKVFDVVTPNSRLGHFTRKIQYKNFFKKHQFDIVHVNVNSPSNYDFAEAALKSGARVIYHSHNDNAESFVLNKNNRTLTNHVRGFQKKKLVKLNIVKVAVSDQAAKWMFSKNDNVTIIPNGVDFEDNKFSIGKRLEGRKQLNIEHNDKVLIAASRLTKQKNFPKVLSIAKKSIEHGDAQQLIIVGDGDQMNVVQNIVKNFPRNVQQYIHILGAQKDMQMWYSVSDVLLMPSIYEGLPYSILEAQSNGLPVIASKAIPQDAIITENKIARLDIESPDQKWLEYIKKVRVNVAERKKYIDIVNNSKYSLEKFEKIIKSLYNIE